MYVKVDEKYIEQAIKEKIQAAKEKMDNLQKKIKTKSPLITDLYR